MIYQIGERKLLARGAHFVAASADVIGSVELGAEASIWFGAVLRADNDLIAIGDRSNVQDNSVLHTDSGIPLHVGNDVTIGHRVMLHGCTIGDNTLIGIGAVVLNGARIGHNCLLGAGSLVTEGKVIPDGSLAFGAPAKVVRPLTEEEIQQLTASALHYVDNARRFRESLLVARM
jgi:carbonic anhydrase/acetyltransferase-like protein (isoleucine patch superfamily)